VAAARNFSTRAREDGFALALNVLARQFNNQRVAAL
jgi:hypothetical protein